MSTVSKVLLFTVTFLLLGHGGFAVTPGKKGTKKTYIVHTSKSHMPASFSDHQLWYASSLKSVSDSADIIYSYQTVLHGFSTRLTEEEAEMLESRDEILSVMPEMRYELHTTRTPEFLGLETSEGLIPASNSAADVIIGVLDTGVWPESKSFDDTGMGPVPSGWKGECEVGKGFMATSCNRKLIGARFFSKGYEASRGPIDEGKETKSPLDNDGHGTHTSTTAGGAVVPGASMLGYAPGTARGMATQARIAAYKVCWVGGCFSSDILAAMESAMGDGVHVISVSLGGGSADYYRDSVAIAGFSATQHGILVSCSAGNDGPGSSSLSNVAPWITTVGAGTLDRDFPAVVSLGNGKNFSSVSLYSGKRLPYAWLPFVYAGNASNITHGRLCLPGTLIPEKVAGKIVLCELGTGSGVKKGAVVKEAGGAGMVLAGTTYNGEELVADVHLLPATVVGKKTEDAIKSYLFSDPNPTATIVFFGTKLGVQPSPVVAGFSSRGPNSITPEILKPDIIAPGVNILAGWTGSAGPTGLPFDDRRVNFNIISGTSMSCPHVSGLAALLRGAHPDWSPAAIRSALMTTAYMAYKSGEKLLDIVTGNPSTPFDHGAGHVDPQKALDPGLAYDITADDYLSSLCAINYTSEQMSTFAKTNYTCDTHKKYSVADLNYPSFAVPLNTDSGAGDGAPATVKYTRTLTNVGMPGTYKASVSSPAKEVKITVEPPELTFSEQYEKKSYTVTFLAESMTSGTSVFTRLEWSDGKHIVGSPIAISWS